MKLQGADKRKLERFMIGVCLPYSVFVLVCLAATVPTEVKHDRKVWRVDGMWSTQRMEWAVTEVRLNLRGKEDAYWRNSVINRFELDAETIKWQNKRHISLQIALLSTVLLLLGISWGFARHLRRCSSVCLDDVRKNDTEPRPPSDVANRAAHED